MPLGQVLTEKGTFWFEGHRFADEEICDFTVAERTRDRRLDIVDTLSDRYFTPPRPRGFERRIQAHVARVAREEPLAEKVADFPPLCISK